VLALALAAGATGLVGLHLAAARHEHQRDAAVASSPWVDVCAVADVPESRGVMACLSGERVAVFRNGDRLSAVSNVCQHQNGPLGEGKIVNGCIVCPWHGYEYVPETGASPPPFTEKIPTFSIRVANGRVLVDPRPHPPGTFIEPARIA
jgi:nitrite reductase/ring-hydroxylating ferredoxin subunit